MKIIVSPSKEMKYLENQIQCTKPMFINEKDNIMNTLLELSIEQIESIYKVSTKLAVNVHQSLRNNQSNSAIYLYHGLVFRQLELYSYNDDQNQFMNDHLLILSSMYGCLKPFDEINTYRLDQKTDIGIDLYKYWSSSVSEYVKDENIILSLASNEYEKIVQHDNIVKIDFVEKKGDSLKRSSAVVKKARGQMLDYIIKNKISNVETLKLYDNGYIYNDELSTKNTLVFIKKV